MSRFVLLAVLMGGCAGCGKPSKTATDQQKTAPTGGGEQIAVPGTKGGPTVGGVDGAGSAATTGAPVDDKKYSPQMAERAKDPSFHLKPEEGTLTIAKVEAKPGSPASVEIKLEPGKGFHVSTDIKTKLVLDTPSGVKLDKTYFFAGGRNQEKGDASLFSEKALAFTVTATPEAAGNFEINGVFNFGICEEDTCRPRNQPIKIQVAAK